MVKCPICEQNACYEQKIDEKLSTQLCMSCGYSSSTLLTKQSEAFKNAVETSPELYKDLAKEGENEQMWLPATLMVPNKGMVFVDGTSKDNWVWASAKAIPLLEPKDGQTHRMDMENKKTFNKNQFMKACLNAGIFDE